ncbi:protein MTO1 homolog, mitochondrial-like [Myxocyprinus asiaticus]|uniref:protein MTO1 homolog, mitochondrial-like n=1 Tax=Myxocyprinus asiaticus TaxID=70543 RepID=UPI0022234F81|nr:protein MTO1 homolog, mitochondrial-like [Myxocyprinus asiaticus]
MLASAFSEIFAPYIEFSERLKVEALYHPHSEKQRREMERKQAEESLCLPQDIDYLTLPVSLSQEVREMLDKARPNTLGADTHLPGITPAANVHLLNYVHKDKHRNYGAGKDVSCFG